MPLYRLPLGLRQAGNWEVKRRKFGLAFGGSGCCMHVLLTYRLLWWGASQAMETRRLYPEDPLKARSVLAMRLAQRGMGNPVLQVATKYEFYSAR